MSLSDHKGTAWALLQLFKMAQQDIEQGGEIKPAKKVQK